MFGMTLNDPYLGMVYAAGVDNTYLCVCTLLLESIKLGFFMPCVLIDCAP